MITTKEWVLGREITFERSLLQEIRAFFNAGQPESPTIPRYSKEYRIYVKKVASEGRLTRWVAPQPIKEKKRVRR